MTTALVAVTCGVCVWALCLSVYPGRLEDALIKALYVCFCVAMFTAIVALPLIPLWMGGLLPQVSYPSHRSVLIAGLAVLTTSAVIWLGLPRRVAFVLSRSAFEQQLSGVAETAMRPRPTDRRRAGIYTIDRVEIDTEGGVYFRTHSHGYGPDTVSYGFVHHPNRRELPFGRADDLVASLGGSWYSFRVSNDW